MPFNKLQAQIQKTLLNTDEEVTQRLHQVCVLLKETVSYYDWVGFYFANHESKTLHLKTYVGEETNHTVIPFGKGICGQVAVSNSNFVVPDVKAQDNYIACSISVKAEIVIPIIKNGKNIGQIDIDSKTADPFSSEDERFLEWICEKVASIL
ncbi:GAF domain-containing protein [Patiriisocius sp. Uisw_017]|jgi:GAF domain-containing protein|uniref:GAF domain-containing protein n=1 Tax=Patiriisocius sp. Uisw_017 TaxID=3230968 RepID=UPI0039ED7159